MVFINTYVCVCIKGEWWQVSLCYVLECPALLFFKDPVLHLEICLPLT